MKGKKVLISAGPTIEPIDPVRFISNHSSGKMGIALARAFIREGAGVTLVAGPIKEAVPGPAKLISVKTAEEMYNACLKDFNTYDIIIMAAAVADYTPEKVSRQKIKKTGDTLNLVLKPTKDILLEMGRRKNENQLLIGFALESENGRKNALEKLRKKNADFIILNSLNDEGAGFGGDTNKISIFGKNNNEFHSVLKSKDEIASDIVHFLSQQQ
jgi:phosphopantothenoylcysteine decarboxylase/phosphopantothenate--cysteine ligase